MREEDFLDQLISQGNRLAKPCRHLYFGDIEEHVVAGYWHGFERGGLCASVKRNDGWLNVFLDETSTSGRVELSYLPVESTQLLHARDARSLPPIDTLFRLGSIEIDEYLRIHRWERAWTFNSNFKGAAAHEYERLWQQQCPLYTNDIAAVQGGWAAPWPDDDREAQSDAELVLWTIADSEPWVEVFFAQDHYSVFQRIT